MTCSTQSDHGVHQPDDTVWIADVGDGDDPLITLGIKNVSFIGSQSRVETMVRAAAELLNGWKRRPHVARSAAACRHRCSAPTDTCRSTRQPPPGWTW
jgi:hypothetical protein